MILRERPSGLRLFLLSRGSILPRIRGILIANIVLASGVAWLHDALVAQGLTINTIPFTLIGLPLAIFLGFRNTAAYERFWEGRKLWGDLIVHSRSLARQCQNLVSGPQPVHMGLGVVDARVRMTLRTAAFAHSLRLFLRDLPLPESLAPWCGDEEWGRARTSQSPSDYLLQAMGRDLGACLKRGDLDACLANAIDRTLSGLQHVAGSCERLKSTPIPFSYTLLLRRTAYVYCFLLPFGLVNSLGLMTPLVVAVVAYTFFGLDALGDEIEEPFGLASNDLPLDALCRTIEISMLSSLQADTIPYELQPVDYQLS